MLQNQPRQLNDYDCGVWVLCTMVAILRGYAHTGVSEAEMGEVRQLFSNYVLSLPFDH
jgi:Ulp1 family protease